MKCSEMYNCCHCGGADCGCGYCFSCKACEHCLADNPSQCIHSPDPVSESNNESVSQPKPKK